MIKWSRNFLLAALSMLLVVTGLTEIKPLPAAALSGSQFDPGLIISDSVFYDFGTMDVDDIQAFLDRQVATCRSKTVDINPGDITCLKLYRENISGSYAIKDNLHDYNLAICGDVPAKNNMSAAEIIYAVARACKINPRVFLVTLQKEQGLVQSSNPTTYMYKAAMGYGCPDSAPQVCGTDSNQTSRLFWQLYRAAWQMRWYGDPRGSFNYYRVGRTIKVAYHPSIKVDGVYKNTCGSQSFVLKSAATAKLYYYTPYVPNAAALNNLFGTGDKCSAYGNRNFWRWYWKWFGSPVGGGFLLRADDKNYYLVVDNKKYLLSTKELQADFSPIGPLGQVSQDYLDSFVTQPQTLGHLIKNASGTYYFVDSGKLFPFTGCPQVVEFGLACTDAVQLSSDQLAAFTVAQVMSSVVPSDPALASPQLYKITAGVKHEILDAAAATAASINTTTVLPVGIDSFKYLPWGDPIARENQVIANRSTGQSLIINGGKAFVIDPATAAEVDLTKWFPASAGTLSSDGISTITDANTIKSIIRDTTNFYLLDPTGKRLISNPTDLVAQASQLPDALVAMIPTTADPLLTPTLVKPAGASEVYWLDGGEKRLVASTEVKARVSIASANTSVQTLTKSALDLVNAGKPVQSPAKLLIDSKNQLFMVDGLSRLVRVKNQNLANEYGLGKPTRVGSSAIAGYTKSGSLDGMKVQCGTQLYFGISGRLQPIASEYAQHYPGSALLLDDLTCRYLKFGTTQLGRFVKSPAGFTYLIENGKRRLIAKSAQYRTVRGATPEQFTIDVTIANLIPIGKNYPSTALTPIAIAGSTPVASPSATPSASPTPTKSPTATPTAKPSASATASITTPCPTINVYKSGTNWFHVISSGDTLAKIAKACSTTTTNLDVWNTVIKDVNVIQLGWIIRVTNN
ncbi:MAG: LysM peptidoglycan-binding domain-containing protein [Micrococcales bacterium]